MERILDEWLVYKNFLRLSVVGQMENMIVGYMVAATVSRLPNEMGGVKAIRNLNSENVLTLSDVLPCPLVILEERMPLDLIYTITAKSNFPVGVREDILNFIISTIMCVISIIPVDAVLKYLNAKRHIFISIYLNLDSFHGGSSKPENNQCINRERVL